MQAAYLDDGDDADARPELLLSVRRAGSAARELLVWTSASGSAKASRLPTATHDGRRLVAIGGLRAWVAASGRRYAATHVAVPARGGGSHRDLLLIDGLR